MTCTHQELKALHPHGECPICPPTHPGPGGLSRDQVIARGSRAKAELCRRSLYKFFIEGWHVLEPNVKLEQHWHIKTLCDHMQWMIEQWAGKAPRVTQNLDINVPPGSLKSRIFSVYGPAWAWLEYPSLSFLCLSGVHDVALRDADYTKELIQSDWYKDTFNPEWEIREDANAKSLFKTTAGGVRQSQGMLASVVGIRRDILILDDPNDIKDISETKLTAVQRAWLAARNRVNDLRRCVRILIQQRVHELDLSGLVLERGGWAHLCIPMGYTLAPCACGAENCDTEFGKNDPRTEPGQVLQPERNTTEVLAAELLGMGSLDYAGQMEQRPTPEGGGMFKLEDWRSYDELPRDKNRRMLMCGKGMMSVDCTFGEGKRGDKKKRDRVGIVVFFPWKTTRYIHYVFAKRMGIVETCEKIREIYDTMIDPTTGDHMIGKTLVELKANGEAVIELMTDKIPGLVGYQPKGDKRSRANATVPVVEAGNCRVRRDQPWTDEFKSELAAFPNGAVDDLVDAFTQGITELATGSNLSRVKALCRL